MIIRRRYRFFGIVQGVGFRPFIYRLAVAERLGGWVQNRHDGVLVEVEGPNDKVEAFVWTVRQSLPPLASISAWEGEAVEPEGEMTFRIIASTDKGEGIVHIPPDAATCTECLAELFDPTDRRYGYPFINCTNCGPRLTIISRVPYDRLNTSMACFPLCPDCRREYEDPHDRRFHAEPNACPVCGPVLSYLDEDGRTVAGDPIGAAAACLKAGLVVAIKGLGGFHLAVDATNEEAVARLRRRKRREEKPLAIMAKDLEAAAALGEIGEEEMALLASAQRPIVLVRRRKGAPLADAVAPGVPDIGVMLPYTPLHHLLMGVGFTSLVMTSGNVTDEPICVGNREAVARLRGVADGFLVHNRDILVRCDDSIIAAGDGFARMVRRSRGFVPQPLFLGRTFPSVLALGAHFKSTVCILKGDAAFISPHIGDLETPQARDFFDDSVDLMERITECRPEIVACDLHPAFYSTRVARRRGGRVIFVQHHHAHVVSCMAENGYRGEVIGLAMDGTGYGTDGTVWGGEFLVADERDFRRMGHILPFSLPGGERAVREPWRVAVSLLRQALPVTWSVLCEELGLLPRLYDEAVLEQIMDLQVSPVCSSLGRLFDGVAALLGIRHRAAFEGQAAMGLEELAGRQPLSSLPYDIVSADGVRHVDFRRLVAALAEGVKAGKDRGALAAAFHGTVISALAEMAECIRKDTGLHIVALSGGCFQNRLLFRGCLEELKRRDFKVLFQRRLPCNDGGIALGQAVCAGARAEAE